MKTIQEGTLKKMETMRREGKTLEQIGNKYHKTKQGISYLFKRHSIVISHGYFRWRCEECGHFNERNYNLIKEPERFRNEICDKCRVKRVEMDRDRLFYPKHP